MSLYPDPSLYNSIFAIFAESADNTKLDALQMNVNVLSSLKNEIIHNLHTSNNVITDYEITEFTKEFDQLIFTMKYFHKKLIKESS